MVLPLRHALRGPLRGNARETAGVALVVFAILTGSFALLIAAVGRGPFLGAAGALLASAIVLGGAGALVLRPRRRAETIAWRE